MKHITIRAILALAFLAGVASAQSATNGVVTLAPSRGSSAFTPGASVYATFNDATRTWHDGTNGYENRPELKYKYIVRAFPGNVPCYVVQVEPTRLFFFLGFLQPNTTHITISLQDPANPIVGEGPILWTETIQLTTQRAAPVLTGAGQWYSFTDARLHEFGVGGFVLPRNGLRFDLALFASNLGAVEFWVVRIEQNGQVVFEALALTEWANQVRPTNLQLIGFPQLPAGSYTARAYALDDETLISPAITLSIN